MVMLMKKGFTLVELLAVIVILALIALITIPVILNVVEKSKTKTYYRSIEAYGKAIEKGIAEYIMDHERENISNLTVSKLKDDNYIKYEGNQVNCDIERINEDKTVYIEKCKINGEEEYVMDGSKYYSYGINENQQQQNNQQQSDPQQNEP